MSTAYASYRYLLKKSTALKNKLHGEKTLGKPSKTVYHSLNRSLKDVQKEIQILEDRLTEILKEEQQKQLTLLKSIPGMGSKTAIMLIVLTDGFSNFENARQLCSYTGITPTLRESSISVRGRSRITKMGNAKLRNLCLCAVFRLANITKPVGRSMNELYKREK